MSKLVLLVLTLVLATRLSPAQVPELLYLKLNTTSGLTTADKAAPGLPGISPTLLGGGAWDTGDPKLGAAAYKASLGVQQSASDGLSVVGAITALGDWTIEFWVKRVSSAGFQQTLFAIDSVGLKMMWDHNPARSNTIRVEGPFPSFFIKGELTSSTWRHLALVHDAQSRTLTGYFDGEAQGQQFLTTPFNIMGTVGPGLLLGNSNSSAPLQGSIDEFRIWDHARTTAQIQAAMNTQLFSTITTDLYVSDIRSPVYLPRSYLLAGAAEVVTAELENFGSATIAAGTSVTLSYSIDGGTPVVETISLPSALTTGQRYVHSFAATADLSAPGHHDILVTASLIGDQDPTNDSRLHSYGGSGHAHLIDQFPWREDFQLAAYDSSDLGPPNWIQEDEGGVTLNFSFHNKSFALASGPPADHSTGTVGLGFYAMTASTTLATSTGAQLSSPLFDLRALTNPRVRFWVYLDQPATFASPGQLSLDVIERPSGTVNLDHWGPVSDLGSNWVEVQVDLSAFAGQAIQLRFRSSSTFQASSRVMSIDDILVYDHQLGLGQPPRPAVAEFDLNDSTSLGFNPVASLENGPYFSSAAPGDLLTFDFSGAPNVPIILLYGPLNPQAATFGSTIGQLDIGGPVDPITGIPTGLGVLFNGNIPFGLDYFFKTTPAGTTSIQTPMPPIPPGVLTTFQAVLFDPVAGVLVCSNAIQLSVN